MRLLVIMLGMLVSGFCTASDDVQNMADDMRYAIQLGASAQPDMARYNKVKRYGYLYTVDAGNGMQRVMLGRFTSRAKADKALRSVKAKGFKDAFVSGGKVAGNTVYTVQYASYLSSDKINWNKLQEVGMAQIDAADGKVKVVSGMFSEKISADEHARGLRSMGYKDAFVRKVNDGILLDVGTNYVSSGVVTSSGVVRSSVSAGYHESTPMQDLPIYDKLSTYERDNIVVLNEHYHVMMSPNDFVPLGEYTPGTLGGVVSQPVTRTYSTGEVISTTTQPVTTSSVIYTQSGEIYTGGGTVVSSTPTSTVVSSTEYRIQLAAVRNYDSTQYSSVAPYGNVTLEPTNNGLNRIILGNFATIDEAKAVLGVAKPNFPGAYILRYDSGVRGGKVN